MPHAPPITQLVTLGDIARRLGESLERVRRILATRPHIRPVARAGNTRVYSVSVIAQVQDEIDAIEQRRQRGASA
jgi:hypothetical protein